MNGTRAAILKVRDLHKHYGELKAVDGISFDVHQGICTGILGPNGAGKTTTIEILEGIQQPTAGYIHYQGKPVDAAYRENIGVQFQSTALQDFLTVEETLSLFSGLYQQSEDLQKIVELCSLHDILKRDARKLSGGQRQRMLLAIALINKPDIIFLDEPTTGLDPQARRNFWALINGIKKAGKTVLMTTHYMEEAYQLCDQLLIMDHGKIIAAGSPRDLLAKHFEDVILELPATAMDVDSLPGRFEILRREPGIEISSRNVNESVQQLLDNGISLEHLKIRPRTLEDLFLELTGDKLRN